MPRRIRYRNPRSIQSVQDINGVLDVLRDILAMIGEFRTVITADYSVTGEVAREVVVCNNTSSVTVTMVASPSDGDQVLVTRCNSGSVTVSFNGKTDISGGSTKVLLSVGDSLNYEFDETIDRWRAV